MLFFYLSVNRTGEKWKSRRSCGRAPNGLPRSASLAGDDPLLHDRITGPVEEFRTNDTGLGYDEAPVGGRFIRIGVGVCGKPSEQNYRWSHTYQVVDPGEWNIKKGRNWIEFTHLLDDGGGYRGIG